MKAENKYELVPKPKSYKDEEEAKALMAPFEVDGWRGEVNDMFNGHNTCGDKQKVRFFRHVAATDDPSIPS